MAEAETNYWQLLVMKMNQEGWKEVFPSGTESRGVVSIEVAMKPLNGKERALGSMRPGFWLNFNVHPAHLYHNQREHSTDDS